MENQPKETEERQPEKEKLEVQTTIVVDLRATGMHRDEIGLHKILQTGYS